MAASTCYNSEPKISTIKHCIKSGHTSVLEACNFTFKITGVSRSLMAQLTRHRIASYSIQSQRYCSMDGEEYIVPSVVTDAAQKEIIENCYSKIADSYSELLSLGAEPENARAVLPNGCPTTIVVTMNVRSLGNFFNERLCGCAQAEIRTMALLMRKAILSCEDINEEGREILKGYFVPKCEKGTVHYCNESKNRTCGRQPRAEEINKILQNYEFKNGELIPVEMGE